MSRVRLCETRCRISVSARKVGLVTVSPMMAAGGEKSPTLACAWNPLVPGKTGQRMPENPGPFVLPGTRAQWWTPMRRQHAGTFSSPSEENKGPASGKM